MSKRLERSRDDRVITGVCGGIATYLGVDASIVRIATVVVSMFTGVGLIIYLVAAAVMPEQGSGSTIFDDVKQQFSGKAKGGTSQSRPDDPTHGDGPIYGNDLR